MQLGCLRQQKAYISMLHLLTQGSIHLFWTKVLTETSRDVGEGRRKLLNSGIPEGRGSAIIVILIPSLWKATITCFTLFVSNACKNPAVQMELFSFYQWCNWASEM